MAKILAYNTLNASTINILNTIRANAGLEYQSLVPQIDSVEGIAAVGDVIYGYPAIANQFLNALMNRIALVLVRSANFYNPFKPLKKGTLSYGETIEEVFVEIAKAREFNVEKAEAREFKRVLPIVKAAFHVINWDVQYPTTIQMDELRRAFTSENGVTDMIARIVDAIYRAVEYDEYLLFKYLLIKGRARQEIKEVTIGNATTDADKNAAITFRGLSNKLTFMSTEYNSAGVHNATPRDEQYIFMTADYNAQFDVNVLASAFNMEKADFMGHLILVDSFDTFDNERFDVIRAGSTMIEEVTAADLTAMAKVKAIIVDKEYFQFYQNLEKFTEKFVASGDYWNYFYRDIKTISTSPFSNAVAVVTP